MAFAKISQVAHYVPEQVVTNHDLAQIMDTNDEWISSRTGIRQRHISRTESTSDLATEVAKKLMAKAGITGEELDFIILATITPDSMMPSTAARVQANIGANKAFAFDLTAACSGFVFALSTAEKFIASGRFQKGLVIGSETLSKAVDWSDRSTAVLFGDGAGGVLLEASEQEHFLAESLNSDGSRSECLTYGHSGLHSPFSDQESADSFLKMDGKIGVDRAKLPANMMEYGNTSAASIPILLSECVEQGLIPLDGSQTVLLSGFGGGLTWGTLILTI